MTRFGPPLVTAHSVVRPVVPSVHEPLAPTPSAPTSPQFVPSVPGLPTSHHHLQHLQQHQPPQPQHNQHEPLAPAPMPVRSVSGGVVGDHHELLRPLSKLTLLPSSASASTAAAAGGGFPMPPPTLWQPREHNILFGRDVIQVPLKVEDRNNEYVNLVLSHREFDVMAVHIPQYDEMRPAALVDEITRLVKEQADKQRSKRHSFLGNQAGEHDVSSIFQARIHELEYEVSRLNTKLAAARALQATLTDENTVLRSNLRELEHRCVDAERLRLQNELLREQAVTAFAENARLKKALGAAHAQLRDVGHELRALKLTVVDERAELAEQAAASMGAVVARALDREHVLQASYLEEKKERQLIAEKYYELSGRIRVFCRLRPVTRHTNAPVRHSALLRPRPNAVLVERNGKEFGFDQVFGPEHSQADVYAQMEPVVVSFADGYNACILAYGQTGSGKTFTMVGGTGAQQGMIPRALQQVFAIVDARRITYEDTLSVSMVEIYNDQILDLLAAEADAGVRIKAEGDITTRAVTLWEHVDAVLAEGNANRNIASTSMNVESSRSHALVFLHLVSQHRETRELRRSTLCLVDLAGSERISRSQVEGERLRETQHINKSLSALGDVMHALQHKAKHVPYRNSKLTFMLRDMLSGQAKTLMMLQLSPEEDDVEETLCSLQFGARVSQIQLGAIRTSVESGEIFRLREENVRLERQLGNVQEQLRDLAVVSDNQREELDAAREHNRRLEADLERQSVDLSSLQENVERMTMLASTAPSVGSATPPASPRRAIPVSPTLSARSGRSTRSVDSTTSGASAPPPRRPPPAKSLTTATASPRPRPTRPTPGPAGTPSPLDRASRRKSLTTLQSGTTATVLAARERLARTSLEPLTAANRRATLSGSIGGGGSARATATATTSSPSTPSSRIPRPRTPGAGTAGTSPSKGTTATARSTATGIRRTNSLATPSPTKSQRPTTPTPGALRTPSALERRRAASARSVTATAGWK